MGLTTERKVFLGLVGVAGLALFIDQGFLGPKEAAANPDPLIADTAGEVSAIGAQAPTNKPAAAVLIDRLTETSSADLGGSLGSSFSLTQLIEPQATVHLNDDQLSESSDQARTDGFPVIATRVVDLPVLSAAMPSANGGGAVLGGKMMRVGQVDPNGYRLVLVHARSVLVERDGVRYAIEMPRLNRQD